MGVASAPLPARRARIDAGTDNAATVARTAASTTAKIQCVSRPAVSSIAAPPTDHQPDRSRAPAEAARSARAAAVIAMAVSTRLSR